MVWSLVSTQRVPRGEDSVEFGLSCWHDRTYEFVREVLFDGSIDWFTVNVWRRPRDK